MSDKEKEDHRQFPMEPTITLTTSEPLSISSCTRYLSFQDHTGAWKRLKMKLRKQSSLEWEATSYPDGIDELISMVNKGNRSYWDWMFLENRGGKTSIPIDHLKIVMNYDDPPGSSPRQSDHIIDGLDLNEIRHGEIPIVDWHIGMTLLGGYDLIDLNEFRKRSLHKWAGLKNTDPDFVRRAVEDMGKSGSDGSDQYGSNPKYGPEIDNLCSEFVTWYYHESGETVDGKSVRDIDFTGDLHEMFADEGTLYRYDSSSREAFVHAKTGAEYVPQSGDWLERRGPDGAEHSMIMYRYLPKDPNSGDETDRENMALVINGPWPITLRLVKLQLDETVPNDDGEVKDYWVGRIDETAMQITAPRTRIDPRVVNGPVRASGAAGSAIKPQVAVKAVAPKASKRTPVDDLVRLPNEACQRSIQSHDCLIVETQLPG